MAAHMLQTTNSFCLILCWTAYFLLLLRRRCRLLFVEEFMQPVGCICGCCALAEWLVFLGFSHGFVEKRMWWWWVFSIDDLCGFFWRVGVKIMLKLKDQSDAA